MGGRLWCDSRLGVGSRFAVRLPRSPILRDPATPQGPDPATLPAA